MISSLVRVEILCLDSHTKSRMHWGIPDIELSQYNYHKCSESTILNSMVDQTDYKTEPTLQSHFHLHLCMCGEQLECTIRPDLGVSKSRGGCNHVRPCKVQFCKIGCCLKMAKKKYGYIAIRTKRRVRAVNVAHVNRIHFWTFGL